MNQSGAIPRPAFTPDGKRIVAICDDGRIKEWELNALDVPAEHLPLWVEVTTGACLTPAGETRLLSPQEWDEKYQQLAGAPGHQLRTTSDSR